MNTNNTEAQFIKLYGKDLGKIFELSASHTHILLAIAMNMSYAEKGQIVSLHAYEKNKLVEQFNTSMAYINNVISSLTKKGFLQRIATGVYRINSVYFGKGDWKAITKIRMILTYDKEGRTIETDITNTEDTNMETRR